MFIRPSVCEGLLRRIALALFGTSVAFSMWCFLLLAYLLEPVAEACNMVGHCLSAISLRATAPAGDLQESAKWPELVAHGHRQVLLDRVETELQVNPENLWIAIASRRLLDEVPWYWRGVERHYQHLVRSRPSARLKLNLAIVNVFYVMVSEYPEPLRIAEAGRLLDSARVEDDEGLSDGFRSLLQNTVRRRCPGWQTDRIRARWMIQWAGAVGSLCALLACRLTRHVRQHRSHCMPANCGGEATSDRM